MPVLWRRQQKQASSVKNEDVVKTIGVREFFGGEGTGTRDGDGRTDGTDHELM